MCNYYNDLLHNLLARKQHFDPRSLFSTMINADGDMLKKKLKKKAKNAGTFLGLKILFFFFFFLF